MDNADLVSIRKRLLPQSSLDPSVALLDLARLHLKMRDVAEGEGWPAEVCALAELEYRRFLTLKRLFFSVSLVPNGLMDKFWHAHILDTHSYHSDCLRLFGEYFHHYPYFGKRGESDRVELARAFQKTKDLYLGIFGEPMDKSPGEAARILSKRGTTHPMLAEPGFFAD